MNYIILDKSNNIIVCIDTEIKTNDPKIVYPNFDSNIHVFSKLSEEISFSLIKPNEALRQDFIYDNTTEEIRLKTEEELINSGLKTLDELKEERKNISNEIAKTLLSNIDYLGTRHKDQIDRGDTTTFTNQEYIDYLTDKKLIRDTSNTLETSIDSCIDFSSLQSIDIINTYKNLIYTNAKVTEKLNGVLF